MISQLQVDDRAGESVVGLSLHMSWKFKPFLSKGQGDMRSVDENSSLALEVTERTARGTSL